MQQNTGYRTSERHEQILLFFLRIKFEFMSEQDQAKKELTFHTCFGHEVDKNEGELQHLERQNSMYVCMPRSVLPA